jgi:ABC-type nitrate/sulfonate/bicarbonate transport system permease component
MNVLVTVGLGLLILSEHQSLDVTRLLAGAALIAVGAVLVSGA